MNGKDVTARADVSLFKDAPEVSSWALDAVKWCVAEGLLSGTSADTLSPTGTATRAQASVILMRFAQNVID